MAAVVEPDVRQAGARADAVEMPVQTPRLHRGADARREDEAVLGPHLAASTRSFACRSRCSSRTRRVILGSGTVASDASDFVSSTRSRPATRWTVCATVGVPLLRSRSSHRSPQLTAAQAECGRDDVQPVQPGLLGLGQDAVHVGDLEALADLVARARDLHELGDVARDQLLALGAAERIPQNSMDELDLPFGRCAPAAAAGRAALIGLLRCRS